MVPVNSIGPNYKKYKHQNQYKENQTDILSGLSSFGRAFDCSSYR